jgi:predicted DNA-binding transcriptional regulator AlpA
MVQSRDELLDTLRRLERNPATTHFMVRAPKGRKASPQERLLKHVLRGAEAAQQSAESAGPDHEEVSQALGMASKKRQERVSEATPEIEAASEPRRWMSTKEVTQYIGICPATLYRLINEQGFPRPRKLGHLSRWLRDEIDTHMMALPTMVIPRIDWIDGKKPKKNTNKN